MKKDIHPEYVDCTVTCTCGNTFQTRSTKSEIRVDICNACHPFFTGTQKLIDSGGRVQRFANKFGSATEAVAAREAEKKAAKAAKAAEAEEAGADFVGAEEMAQKIQSENWFDFDVIIATPDMMGVVGRLGKILGPKGLMPNPKSGTVTMDVTKAIADVKAGKVEYRLDKTNIIHTPIGKASFGAEKLTDNFNALLGAIIKAKPAAAKGQYLRSVTVATTMGPGVKINPLKLG